MLDKILIVIALAILAWPMALLGGAAVYAFKQTRMAGKCIKAGGIPQFHRGSGDFTFCDMQPPETEEDEVA